jgi:hypothetical protein
MCFACGKRLNAAPAPKKEEPPAAESSPVGAKTTFGMMSPIAKPAAPAQPAKPAAAPAAKAWGMPKPQAKPAQAAPEPAPAPEPVPARTMFGVGMAVQPAMKSAPAPVKPPAPEPEPEPMPVPPKTMFGVGVAAPAAPSAPVEMPPAAPPVARMEPRYEPAAPPQVIPMEPIAQPRQPTPAFTPAALAETIPAPEPSKAELAVPNGDSLASSQERDILGDDSDLPRTPPQLSGEEALQMPAVPSNPAQLLFYFLKVLGARVSFLREARKLEDESKQWQQRVDYLLATIGLRSQNTPLPEAAQQQAQISALSAKITGLVQQQQTTMGEKGQRSKAFEEREIELNRDIVDKEGAYTSLNSQLKDIEAVRRDLQNKLKQQPPPPIEVANEFTKTDAPYHNLKTQTEAAKTTLQDARAKYASIVKEKKQMLKDTETQMKASNTEIQVHREELKKLLIAVGQAALLQSAPAAQMSKAEIQAVNEGIAVRQTTAQQYRAQLTAIDKAKFNQGAGAFAGVLVVVLIVLFLLKP